MTTKLLPVSNVSHARLHAKCPACGGMLAVNFIPCNRVAVWCPLPDCKSEACANGVEAGDIESACDAIATAHNSESRASQLPMSPTSPNWENSIEAFLMRD
jgi:hypothetical protein